jgi:LemA protein
MVFGFQVKPTFTVENEAAIAAPPKVDFSAPAPSPAGPSSSTGGAPSGSLSQGY